MLLDLWALLQEQERRISGFIVRSDLQDAPSVACVEIDAVVGEGGIATMATADLIDEGAVLEAAGAQLVADLLQELEEFVISGMDMDAEIGTMYGIELEPTAEAEARIDAEQDEISGAPRRSDAWIEEGPS